MLARVLIPFVVISVSLSVYGRAQAQSRVDTICWADNKDRCPAPWNGPDVTFYHCPVGNMSGFNTIYVCQQVCGTEQGPHCKIISGPAGEGGYCGYRAARVECYK